MDHGLLTWARQVKQRTKTPYPTLWLFTDSRRLPDPLPVISRLPPFVGGVVYRHNAAPNRLALGRAIAALCRQRHIALVIAGDGRLAVALRAGSHLRSGAWPDRMRTRGKPRTASAHKGADIIRARRAGAQIIFISPVFQTASHPGDAQLGNIRWLRLARLAHPAKACALGGITGQKIKTLSYLCCGAASISALLL